MYLGVGGQVHYQIWLAETAMSGYFSRAGHTLGQIVLKGGNLTGPGILALVNA
jgi:hypothetical protein